MAFDTLEGIDREDVNGSHAVADSSREGEFSLSISDERALNTREIGLPDVDWLSEKRADGVRHREASTEARMSRSSDSELGGFFHGMELHDLRENDVGLISDEEFEKEFGNVSGAALPNKWGSSGKGESQATHGGLLGKSAVHPLAATFLKTIMYILLWYIFSTCLTMYNKELLGEKLGKFPAPLLMNTVHFSMQAITSSLMLRYCCTSMQPNGLQIGLFGEVANIVLGLLPQFVVVTSLPVVPTATATALDINLSNESFIFISVTFATMCKSAAPVFLLLFAFAFKLESPSFKLLSIIVVISSGVLLTAAKETEFDLIGFILVMLATVMAGFRWTVTQILLQKEQYGLNNPLAVMSRLTPVMAVLTFVCSIILEPWHTLAASSYFDSASHGLQSCALMLLGGFLAFCMVVAEYLVISETSAVTLTVAGVVKEVVTIVVAVFFFGDKFTFFKGVGLVVIIVGVCLFNWFKYQKVIQGQIGHADSTIESIPVKYTILKEVSSEAHSPEVIL